jgi:PHD/YefM family antitoxin component YafN of YafNO toxin-antitoxin module
MWYNYTTERSVFMPHIIPIRDLKNTSTVSELCHTSSEPIFITKNGYGDMVIMSMEMYEERMAVLDLKKKIHAAEENVKENKVSDAMESLGRIREKYNV